jgi:hypothetical protein
MDDTRLRGVTQATTCPGYSMCSHHEMVSWEKSWALFGSYYYMCFECHGPGRVNATLARPGFKV